MNEHRDLREAISEIDDQLLELLNRRSEVAQKIGAEKRAEGRPVLDLEREERNLERLGRDNRGPLSAGALEAIYREIMSAAREAQGPRPVGYLGSPDGQCHLATLQRFGRSAKLVEHGSPEELLRDVGAGRLECGVLSRREVEGRATGLSVVELRGGASSPEEFMIVSPSR